MHLSLNPTATDRCGEVWGESFKPLSLQVRLCAAQTLRAQLNDKPGACAWVLHVITSFSELGLDLRASRRGRSSCLLVQVIPDMRSRVNADHHDCTLSWMSVVTFHVNRVAATESIFGGIIASGFQTIALTFRLFSGYRLADRYQYGWPWYGRGAVARQSSPVTPCTRASLSRCSPRHARSPTRERCASATGRTTRTMSRSLI